MVSFPAAEALAEAVQKADGGVAPYTGKGYGHGLFVPMRMDNNVLDWLFRQSKEQPAK
ncbi:MAG: hypothetical protein IJD39_02715 [Clostridia bacterium]|nr:hypothetical protein [Clostridia bacterium]